MRRHLPRLSGVCLSHEVVADRSGYGAERSCTSSAKTTSQWQAGSRIGSPIKSQRSLSLSLELYSGLSEHSCHGNTQELLWTCFTSLNGPVGTERNCLRAWHTPHLIAS